MENALLIGLSRQIALHRELEVVANNIANLDTTGYKADGSVFEEFLMPVANAGSFQAADRRLSYVQDRAAWHNLNPGPIRQTGNPLDVAIDDLVLRGLVVVVRWQGAAVVDSASERRRRLDRERVRAHV